jgi:hypothetical protein
VVANEFVPRSIRGQIEPNTGFGAVPIFELKLGDRCAFSEQATGTALAYFALRQNGHSS